MTPKEEEMRGFNDATGYLLDPRPDADPAKWSDYCKPPERVPGCVGCASDVVTENDCPACRYDLGFTEGLSK